MKPAWWTGGILFLAAAGLLWWAVGPQDPDAAGGQAREETVGGAPEPAQIGTGARPSTDVVEPAPATARERTDEPAIREQGVRPDPDAVTSLRRAREEGDPRTPPLASDTPERIMPTDQELADPDLYLEYEARQKQQVLTSFLQASEKKAGELRRAIERAEGEGLPEEQLAEGREKLERLEAMREQLLRDHPELAPSGEQEEPASP